MNNAVNLLFFRIILSIPRLKCSQYVEQAQIDKLKESEINIEKLEQYSIQKI